ncbi:carbohydrate porin [Luteimonas deserti]|uniref:Carbohydrate porin n=1 Tax=Luteimonas deserti TaxID=2752306 RepID=A0A7Z0TYY2_9GAMM|nr:carbohydrate porin [Luteimonas deserti]NYZ63365.1 carbohydrate porin [Luteimonas deserti]
MTALAGAPAFAAEDAYVAFAYTGEYARSVGAQPAGDAYADQFHLSAGLDSQRLGWGGGQFVIELTHRTGTALEQELALPLLQQVQSVYGAGDVTRLTRLSYRHAFQAVPLTVTAGRLYPNADFLAFSCHYQHMSFCGGAPGNVTNGWFADPVSQYGAVLALDATPAVQLKLGAYDVNPGHAASGAGLRLESSGGSTGTLVIGEIERSDGARGRWRLGTWHDSSAYALLSGADVDAAPAMRHHETGSYLSIERTLARLPSGATLHGFLNIVRADAYTNAVDRLDAIGVWLDAPFAARPDDRLALAVGRTQVNGRLLRGEQADAAVHAEYPVELNYSAVIGPWLTLMPNLQRIRQTGPGARSLTVFGLRVELAL